MTTDTKEAELILDLEPIEQPASNLPAVQAPADNSPMSMMLAAQKQGASLADIREMMAIQREWKANEARDAFRQDFAAFRGENIIIPKSKSVDRGKAGSFMQAEYDEVCRRLSPALSRHGFGFRHDQRFDSRKWTTDGAESDIAWVYVTCHLEHRLGHSEKLELEGPPGDLSANTPVQNMQATASYLKRQSLLAITGTATGGEDDENALRRRSTDGDKPGQDDAAIQAGKDASVNGMKALTAWWATLDSKQRSRLTDDFTAMRKVAQAADKAVGP